LLLEKAEMIQGRKAAEDKLKALPKMQKSKGIRKTK
jgi:hypothetical protein